MEAVERWTANHPELQDIATLLRGVSANIAALGEPSPLLSLDDARAKIDVELAEFQAPPA